MSKEALCVLRSAVRVGRATEPNYYPIRGTELEKLLPNPVFMPRDQVEEDPTYLQIIPYIMLRKGDEIFTYSRGVGGGEARLHSNYSIGLGGHIDREDSWVFPGKGLDIIHTILCSAERELREEVGVTVEINTDACHGLLFDPTTPVGNVHLGVLMEVEITTKDLTLEAEIITNGKFLRPKDILTLPGSLETWSNLAFWHRRQERNAA